jgi:hypothetical protein
MIEATTLSDVLGAGHEEPGPPSGPGLAETTVEPAAEVPEPGVTQTPAEPAPQAPGPGFSETAPPVPGPGLTQTTAEPAPPVPGPGFAETTAEPAAPVPGPDSPPRNEWSDWYASTEPRRPVEAPLSRPPTNLPPASPLPPYQPQGYQPQGYQPPGYQPRPYQPPVYPQSVYPPSAAPYSGYQQPYRPQPQPTGPGAPLASPRSPMPPRPPRGPAGGDRPSHVPLFWSAVFAVLAVAVVVVLALLHPLNRHQTINEAANSTKTARPATSAAVGSPTASPQSSPSASGSTSASVSSAAVTVQRAASAVAGMLASSVTDRTAIDSAFDDVDSCGPNLDGDAAVFNGAASSRRALLTSLATMPGRSALPAALVGDLAKAWQASIAADQGFATWANDEVSEGCVKDDTNDPGYRASIAPDSVATEYKTDFAAEWNPIATRYGLTTYQQSQL